jgi:hypothetical protein
MVKREKDLALGICRIWSMASGVIVNRISPEDETILFDHEDSVPDT